MPPARYATAEPHRPARDARTPRDPRTPGDSRDPRAARANPRAAPRSRRAPRPSPALSWVNGRAQIQRVRWDRVGRVALVIVLAVVALLYIQHAVSYLQARGEANHQQAIVKRLEQANAALVRRQKQLNDPATIVKDARELGMVWMGERPYSVNGLPNH